MIVGSDRVFTRFIPAGAGTTLKASAQELKNSVYPRWRGEHDPHDNHPGINFGLSPLTRGTPI